jgi:hypothetical protein
MELVAIIKELDIIEKRIPLNLSDEVFVTMEKDAIVINDRITRNNFFFGDKISNITVFVGENGTGKTRNICADIFSLLSSDNIFLRHALFVVKEDETFKIIGDSTYKNYPIINLSQKNVLSSVDTDIKRLIENLRPIYLSTDFLPIYKV